MYFPSENELFFGSGSFKQRLEKQVQLTNIDFYKILPKITKKQFIVIKYSDFFTNPKPLVDYNIILYHFPGFVGH
jgi:hypothetical protein